MGTRSVIAGIPVYVISLKDSETRRRNMTERLGALGIPFQFVDAIDGRTQRLPDQFDGARVMRDGFDSEGAIGCAMSHRLVHRIIAEGSSTRALILEDDAKLSAEFPRALATATTLDCDLVKLEGAPWKRHIIVGNVGPYSINVGVYPSMGTAAYLIHQSAAARFCQRAVIDQPIDLAFGDYRLALRVLELTPYPAAQDHGLPRLAGCQPAVIKPSVRPSAIRRLARSALRRYARVRAYGWRTALALELTRVAGNTR